MTKTPESVTTSMSEITIKVPHTVRDDMINLIKLLPCLGGLAVTLKCFDQLPTAQLLEDLKASKAEVETLMHDQEEFPEEYRDQNEYHLAKIIKEITFLIEKLICATTCDIGLISKLLNGARTKKNALLKLLD